MHISNTVACYSTLVTVAILVVTGCARDQSPYVGLWRVPEHEGGLPEEINEENIQAIFAGWELEIRLDSSFQLTTIGINPEGRTGRPPPKVSPGTWSADGDGIRLILDDAPEEDMHGNLTDSGSLELTWENGRLVFEPVRADE